MCRLGVRTHPGDLGKGKRHPSPTMEHGSGVHTRPHGATEQTVSASPMQPEVVRMRLAGANPAAAGTGLDGIPGKRNYFPGNYPSKWHGKLPTDSPVSYH